MAVDGSGNVFFADSIYNVVLRRDAATGMLTLAAGSWVGGYSGDDGPAARAQLNSPAGIAVDGAGNLYIADRGNYRVRKVSKGIITTVAGSGTYTLGNAYIGDGGPATEAQIAPAAVAVDGSGSLFIADLQNGRIRKVSNGVITTVAGNGSFDPSGDGGSATSAGMAPGGVAVDSAGNIYLLDGQNHNVRAISNGVITTVASGLYPPEGIAVDAADNLFVADPTHVRKASNGVTTTVVGNGSLGNAGDGGPATAASIWPSGLAVDIYGNIYLAEEYNYKIRMVSNGVINTIVGSGSPCCYIGDDGPATAAQFGNVGSIALSSTGDLYLADTFLDRIRKVSNGIITTVATGAAGPVTIDAWENIFFAHNYQVFRLSNGTITTVAGSGIRGFGGDGGPATSAQLCGPVGLAVDAGGQLYIADAGANRVRKVSNGVIATVAGSGSSNCSQTGTYSGDNGPATSAGLNQPAGVAVDSAGNLYIADLMNNAVRKVSNGIITTIAGNGTQGFSGDNGLATSAQMNNPGALAIDSAGSLYISDFGNARMRKVQNGVITTIAGGGSGRGDGVPSTGVRIATAGVAVDAAGNVYFAEPYSPASDVRVLVPAGPRCTASSVSPLAISVPGSGGGFEVAIQAGFLCDWAAQGAPDWITLSSGVGIGSSILTMSVAANYGPPRFASFSVAGMDVVVTQKAPLRIVRREPGPPGPRWPRR